MKVGIVGCGFVGSTAAYALVMQGIGREVVLVDKNTKRAGAEADDIRHAVPFAHPLEVRAGDYPDLAGCRAVVLCAGVGQKPGESRLGLLQRNAAIFAEIVPQILSHAPDAVLVVATNPVDVMTHLTARVAAKMGVPAGQVFGSGTTLDTARFRSLLGRHCQVDPHHVHAYVLGEHGDSEVLPWSQVTIGGMALDAFVRLRQLALTDAIREDIDRQVRRAAYTIIEGKGATYYGIGSALARIVDVVQHDQRAILSVCCPTPDVCEVKDVTVSLPRLVGGRGVIESFPMPLSDAETSKLRDSARLIRDILDKLEDAVWSARPTVNRVSPRVLTHSDLSRERQATDMNDVFSLRDFGIDVAEVHRNLPPSALYEHAIKYERDARIAENGALVTYSGIKTGRSPLDKRVVKNAASEADVWWGNVNIPLDPQSFAINRERARDYLNTRERVYCIDGYAGWDPRYQLKIRVICTRPYHALFMHNMLIRPTPEQLAEFGQPDFVIYNAGAFPANRLTAGMGSKTSIDLCFEDRELVILGTEYAGEMKKGVFTVVNYFSPKAGMLSMHCSATTDKQTGQSSLMFGLSGTGKTTLSADPKRLLIGDDEHCWTDEGVYNVEGGCYAKAVNLTSHSEPDIYRALRYGAVLENVVLRPNRAVNFSDTSITENTRGSYPIEYIPNAQIPCMAGHPNDVIFLTCDAFGVLPPVSKLTPAQAMYHYISGYTAKVAGTEVGIKEPTVTFSPCFGGPFLVWHPSKYAGLLAEKLAKHGSRAWLVNTGWSGGPPGVGERIKLSMTRAIVDSIHEGTLADAPVRRDPVFGLDAVFACANVPSEMLWPRDAWQDKTAYDTTAKNLAGLFVENFRKYESAAAPEVKSAGPVG